MRLSADAARRLGSRSGQALCGDGCAAGVSDHVYDPFDFWFGIGFRRVGGDALAAAFLKLVETALTTLDDGASPAALVLRQV